MSEGIIIALITALGSLLGGIVGQSITASATVRAAQIKEKASQSSFDKDEQTPSSWGRIIVGALLGAIVTLIILFTLGMIPPNVDNPPIATTTKVSSTSTPSDSVPSFLESVSVPANLSSGINYQASKTGTYIFKYTDTAATNYTGCWVTAVLGYLGPVPRWDNENNLDSDKALFEIGTAVCSLTKDAAIKRTQGQIATIELNKDDVITLVEGDSHHADNVGAIILDVYFVEN